VCEHVKDGMHCLPAKLASLVYVRRLPASYAYSASIASCVCEHVKDDMHCLPAKLAPLFYVACLL
jgi:hypothetical protein